MTRYRRVLGRALPLVIVAIATATGIALLLTGVRLAGSLLAVAVIVAVWWRHRFGTDSRHGAVRGALVVALSVAAGARGVEVPLMLAAAGLLLAVIIVEPALERHLTSPIEAFRLPAPRPPIVARFVQPVFTGSCAALVALATSAAGLLPTGPVAIVVCCWLLVCAAVAAYQLARGRRHLPERAVRSALTDWQPEWYLHFSGKPEAAYQVQMWLPYLERTGRRGLLLVRERAFLPTALRITEGPVVLAETVESLEYAMVPGLSAIFYPNNAIRNADGTRYQQLTHVHLGHGDSDKPASYASSTAMFDRIFVAGQAGVDRFAAHGVEVPPARFVLVGRPQVEAIAVRPADARLPERPVVLYAPTWRGVLADMQLSSLDAGERIVTALLDAGARVIFRPHPFARRDATSRVLVRGVDAVLAAAGDGQVLSAEAARRTIFECMNASDALVADVSSVASDYLYSGKPLALAHHGSAEVVRAEYPLAAAAWLLSVEGDSRLDLSGFLGDDLLAGERTRMRDYYLGPWPDKGYSDVFVAAAAEAAGVPRPGDQHPSSR